MCIPNELVFSIGSRTPNLHFWRDQRAGLWCCAVPLYPAPKFMHETRAFHAPLGLGFSVRSAFEDWQRRVRS